MGRCIVAYGLLLVLLGGCGLFDPRTPEAPEADSGTYLQPDTPDRVVANLQAAVAELNVQNYRRSLAEALVFEPTATALARTPATWSGWGRTDETAYFTALASDAQFGTGHQLVLSDPILSFVTDTQAQYDATYALTVQHRRPGVPTTVEGQLVWTIEQGEDGLWQLTRWIDRERGAAPSWSDLKAAFTS